MKEKIEENQSQNSNEQNKFLFENWQERNKPLMRSLETILKKHPKSEIYLVGGAVRDFILSRPTQDLDFVVRGIKLEDLEKSLAELGKVDLVGKSFSVFKFVPQGGDSRNPVDIALPRKEHSLGTGAYRDVKIQSDPHLSIEDDLSRRDFTVNAMAWPVKFGKQGIFPRRKFVKDLVDPFGGIKDVKDKIIRAVGKPEKRFQEDYSRQLRALRLACQLNFEIEEKTFKAIKEKISHINDIRRNVALERSNGSVTPEVIEERIVPWEVIGEEFLKSFIANPEKAFDLYDVSGAFKEMVPEILKMKGCPQPKNWHSEGDVWTHTRLCLKNLDSKEYRKEFGDSPPSPELILAVLFHDIGKPYTIQLPPVADRIRFNEHDIKGAEITQKILKRLKLFGFPHLSFDYENVVWLVAHHMLLVQGDISKMRPGTIEKYFFNPSRPGKDLLKLSFVDILSTIPEKGKQDFSSYQAMLSRIEEIKSLSPSKKEELPPYLLSGDEIMQRYNLRPGPKIGELKELVREAQLKGEIRTKKEAYNLLDKEMIEIK